MPTRYVPHLKPTPEIAMSVLAVLNSYHPLSEGLQQAFIARSFSVQVNKGDHLLKQGENSHYLYFLIRGIITGYRLKGNQKIITFITIDRDFVSAINGMYGDAPSDENMVAEEDSYLIGIRSTDLLHFFEAFPEMNVIMRKILENNYRSAHNRAVISRMGTAKEKYEYYLKTLPGHQDRVSFELVANFLDMKLQTLLKIKKAYQIKHEPAVGTAYLAALAQTMVKEKLYQRKKISLKSVAEHLNLKPHHLSYLLNDYYQQNFTDFVNTYRINFVKEQLLNKVNFQQTTIEALGNLAGFSSKSTYFSVFKKQTGLSPLAYAKKLFQSIETNLVQV